MAIDSAPFRGVLPLPLSALRSAKPVIANPANYRRAVMLTYEQFRYSFVNAVTENEARRLYEAYPVPGSGIQLFQAATANINPFTEVKADTRNPLRGPLLLITGEHDHIAPRSTATASFKRQRRNNAVTRIQEIPGRDHSLVFDSGWQDVAETALQFLKECEASLPGAATAAARSLPCPARTSVKETNEARWRRMPGRAARHGNSECASIP